MALSSISISPGMRSSVLTLQALSENIQKTQQRLANGKRVNSALDDPTNFFAAASHLQRANDINTRKDDITEGIQVIKASESGITAITSLLYTMKAIGNQGLTATNSKERNDYAATYTAVRNQINTLAADSGYRGTNLLGAENLTMNFSQTTGDSTLVIEGFDSSADGLGVGNKFTSGTGRIVAQETRYAYMSGSPPSFISGGSFRAVFDIGDVSQTTIGDAPNLLSFSNSAPTNAPDKTGAFPDVPPTSISSKNVNNGTLTVTGTTDKDATVTYTVLVSTPIVPTPLIAPFTQLIPTATPVTTIATVTWGGPNYLERTFPTGTDPANVLEVQIDGVKQQPGNYLLTDNGIEFISASTPTVGQVVTFVRTDSWDSIDAVNASLKQVDGALDILRTKSKALSSTLSVASTRLDFNRQVIDILNQGADNLTLADMDMESANMLMLQTRQNLGTTSLKLGSYSQQDIMKLFI